MGECNCTMLLYVSYDPRWWCAHARFVICDYYSAGYTGSEPLSIAWFAWCIMVLLHIGWPNSSFLRVIALGDNWLYVLCCCCCCCSVALLQWPFKTDALVRKNRSEPTTNKEQHTTCKRNSALKLSVSAICVFFFSSSFSVFPHCRWHIFQCRFILWLQFLIAHYARAILATAPPSHTKHPNH